MLCVLSSCYVYKAGRNLTKHVIHSFDLRKDRAWKEQTTSIFDLETLEIEAERRGETAPWANPDGGDEMFPGFDPDGKMKIGGS